MPQHAAITVQNGCWYLPIGCREVYGIRRAGWDAQRLQTFHEFFHIK